VIWNKPTNVRRHCTKFSRHGDLATGNCALLIRNISYCKIMKWNELDADWMSQSVQSMRCGLHVRESILSERAGQSFVSSPSQGPDRLLRPTQPSIRWASGAPSVGVKRPGREADHSPQPLPWLRITGATHPLPHTLAHCAQGELYIFYLHNEWSKFLFFFYNISAVVTKHIKSVALLQLVTFGYMFRPLPGHHQANKEYCC